VSNDAKYSGSTVDLGNNNFGVNSHEGGGLLGDANAPSMTHSAVNQLLQSLQNTANTHIYGHGSAGDSSTIGSRVGICLGVLEEFDYEFHEKFKEIAGVSNS
jgi:hypothetical protein